MQSSFMRNHASVLAALLLYACPAWSEFLNEQLQMVLNKAARYSFLPLSCRTIDELFESSDNTLFSAILNNLDHVLHFLLLPPKVLDVTYVSVAMA